MSSKQDPSASTAPAPKKKKRGKKEKKQKIEISLWINHTKYEFGILCTFCTKSTAVCHCPECTDFYCASCDATAHLTKKRKDHIRTKISKLDLHSAAKLVTFAVRYHGHLRTLQQRCREVFFRYFDRKTLNYYYYNPVYKSVSWRKPYCLRKLELKHYMPPEYAASKCQNLYHLWIAREKARTALLAQYKKVFDRRMGEFYYTFNGKSRLLPRQSWKKPYLLGQRSFPKDLKPVWTQDVAALTIQRKWRKILMYQYLRALVRATHDEVWDPVSGTYTYFHREAEVLHKHKPKLLGREPWDPNRVPDWSIERVSLFLRRIGLKRYVDTFVAYEVDGKALILLDMEDYDNMLIRNRIHIKKIQVEISRIFKADLDNEYMSEAHMARRERIRRIKMRHTAAVLIQRNFRVFSSKKEVQLKREIERIKIIQAAMKREIEKSRTWYTDVDVLPSKQKKFDQRVVTKTGVELPPIKTFGRHRDHMSFRGWGRYSSGTIGTVGTVGEAGGGILHKVLGDEIRPWQRAEAQKLLDERRAGGKWIPAPLFEVNKRFLGDEPTSKLFTEKLLTNGYDEKREKQFIENNSHSFYW